MYHVYRTRNILLKQFIPIHAWLATFHIHALRPQVLMPTLASHPPGKLFFVSQSPVFSEVCCVSFLRQSSLRLGLLVSSFRPETEQLMLFFLHRGLLRCDVLVRLWLLAFLSPVAWVECHCSFCCPYCFDFLALHFVRNCVRNCVSATFGSFSPTDGLCNWYLHSGVSSSLEE